MAQGGLTIAARAGGHAESAPDRGGGVALGELGQNQLRLVETPIREQSLGEFEREDRMLGGQTIDRLEMGDGGGAVATAKSDQRSAAPTMDEIRLGLRQFGEQRLRLVETAAIAQLLAEIDRDPWVVEVGLAGGLKQFERRGPVAAPPGDLGENPPGFTAVGAESIDGEAKSFGFVELSGGLASAGTGAKLIDISLRGVIGMAKRFDQCGTRDRAE